MKLVAVDTGAVRPRTPSPQIEYVTGGGVRCSVEATDAQAVPFELGLSVRNIPNHPGQRHTPGTYFFATTATMIGYESNLERQWLTALDFDPTVTAVLSQPLRFLGPAGDSWLDHVPDFFTRRIDGSGCVVDVKHPRFVDDDQVVLQRHLTAQVCESAGFDYWFVSAMPEPRWANISWLSGFRRRPHVGCEHVERLLHIARRPTRLMDLCAFGDAAGVVPPVVFHLCWLQQLVFDLDQPLREDTLLSTGGG